VLLVNGRRVEPGDNRPEMILLAMEVLNSDTSARNGRMQ
jgi:hypothetical protein